MSRHRLKLIAAIPFVLAGLALLHHWRFGPRWRTGDSPGRRVIRFPEKYSAGALFIRGWRSDQAWRPLGGAYGAVRVPAGQEVLLKFHGSEVPSLWRGMLRKAGMRARAKPTASLEVLDHLRPDDLQGLSLASAALKDNDLERIARFTSLRELNLALTPISDGDLAVLRNLTALENLGLAGTSLSDAGAQHLEALTALRTLTLSATRISDDGLFHLRGLSRLEVLRLGGTPITNAGLTYLKDLENLRELDISHTPVSRAGLQYLENLPSLCVLWLGRTKITYEEKAEFRRARPDCEIR